MGPRSTLGGRSRIGNRLINARAETVDEKNSFRDTYQNRRCLVLADGFYEWAETGNDKQPYRVVAGDEPFAMAGLWEQWDPADADGQADLESFADDDGGGAQSEEVLETYTIITTEPNEAVGDIHDRMPVVLAPDEEDQWLAGDTSGDLKGLLIPMTGRWMSIRCRPRSITPATTRHRSWSKPKRD